MKLKNRGTPERPSERTIVWPKRERYGEFKSNSQKYKSRVAARYVFTLTIFFKMRNIAQKQHPGNYPSVLGYEFKLDRRNHRSGRKELRALLEYQA